MAVHAQYHALPHDLRAITTSWRSPDNASAFLVADPTAAAGGNTDTVLSDLACNSDSHSHSHDRGCLGTRKRAGATMDLQGGQHALLPPMTVPQALAHVQSRALCSGAAGASTSGRPATSAAPVSQGLLSQLYRHGVEIDLLLRIESERLRAGLQDARRRHARAVLSAVERAAARRLRAAEALLERALARNAELDARLRQTEAEGQAWQDIARSHEGIAAGLRAALDNLIQTQSPRGGEGAGEGDAEDAQSCCFELEQEREREQDRGAEASCGRRTRACRWCGAAEACVLLLPCRHLCLCRGCEAGVGACPVCAATKNAALHVLLS